MVLILFLPPMIKYLSLARGNMEVGIAEIEKKLYTEASVIIRVYNSTNFQYKYFCV